MTTNNLLSNTNIMIKIFNLVIFTKKELWKAMVSIRINLTKKYKKKLEEQDKKIRVLTAEKSQIKKYRWQWKQKYYKIRNK